MQMKSKTQEPSTTTFNWIKDLIKEVEDIGNKTGYGDVSVVVHIRQGKVYKLEFLGSATKVYD